MDRFLRFLSGVASSYYGETVAALAANPRRLALFFPVYHAKYTPYYLSILQSMGLKPACVLAFRQEGDPKDVGGLPLLDLGEAARAEIETVFISRVNNITFCAEAYLQKLGCRCLGVEILSGMRQMRRSFTEHLESIGQVYRMLDREGQEHYLAEWERMLSGDLAKGKWVDTEQYFLAGGYMPKEGDICIDGGAFDGGTAREFLSVGCRVHSFEMDEQNYRKVQQQAVKLGFVANNAALGAASGFMSYSSAGAGSSLGQGDKQCRVEALDEYVQSRSLPRLDFVKLDIEGAELEALQGASASITKWKPRLAICLYHRPRDMWEIPLYIKSLNSEYEFSVRHHTQGLELLRENELPLVQKYGFETKIRTVWETVLYAK